MVDRSLFKGELGLADLLDNVVDERNDLLVGLVGQLDAAEQDVLGDLVGLGLNHDHLLRSGGDGDEHVRPLMLIIAGVYNVAAVHIGHLRRGHGAVPGNIGIGCGDESAQGGDNLNGVVVVVGKGGAGDDNVVAQVVVKEGTHRPVDQTAHQNAALRGTALAAQICTGDPAHGVHPLFKIDGQREILDAGLGGGRRHGGDQHHGVAVPADALAVAQLRDLAGNDGEGAAADFGLEYMLVGEFFFRYHRETSCFVFSGTGRLALETGSGNGFRPDALSTAKTVLCRFVMKKAAPGSRPFSTNGSALPGGSTGLTYEDPVWRSEHDSG